MPKKHQKIPVCAPLGKEMNCCKVESIISVDERGQMVLPKELRDKAISGQGISWRSSAGIKVERYAAST